MTTPTPSLHPSTPSPSPSRSLVDVAGSVVADCGYCTEASSSHAFGVWAHRLRVHDYQRLLDAGWRRSGCYLYRPDLHRSCCQPFVIRLDATRFTPSSTHRRVLKRLRRHSSPTSFPTTNISSRACPSVSSLSNPDDNSTTPSSPRDPIVAAVAAAVATLCTTNPPPSIRVYAPRPRPGVANWVSNAALALAAAKRRNGTDTSGPPHVEQMTWARRLLPELCRALPNWRIEVTHPGFLNFFVPTADETMREGFDDEIVDNSISTRDLPIRDVRNAADGVASGNGAAHFVNAATRMVRDTGDSRLADRAALSVLQTSERPTKSTAWPATVHEDATDIPDVEGGTNIDASEGGGKECSGKVRTCASEHEHTEGTNRLSKLTRLGEGRFSMELVPAHYASESYELFQRYQMTVHNEEREQCGQDTYRRFLVDSPLISEPIASDTAGREYGSFHILYRLGGQLFAVGVVDILPRCLSSVYLFYDPEFRKLSPGTLAALKEIEWVQKEGSLYPSLRFYYMGFYIHSCPKMRYKAHYVPSEILCDETKTWMPAADAQAVLDAEKSRVVRLAPAEAKPALEAAEFDIGNEAADQLVDDSQMIIRVEIDEQRVVSMRTLERCLGTQCVDQLMALRQRIKTFVKLVGRSASKLFDHVI